MGEGGGGGGGGGGGDSSTLRTCCCLFYDRYLVIVCSAWFCSLYRKMKTSRVD